jgi:hypothetical protein
VIGFAEQPFCWSESKMSGLPKTFMLAGAAAAVAIMVLIETPFAQNSDVGGSNPAQPLMGGAAPNPASAAASDKKAEAAMTVEPNSASPTDADRKAAAAMGMGSSPAPTK